MLSGWPDLIQDIQLKPFATRTDELLVQDGCIPWGNRWSFPKQAVVTLLRELHKTHPGETWMKRLACMFVWWPGLDYGDEQKSRVVMNAKIVDPIHHWHCLYPGNGQVGHGHVFTLILWDPSKARYSW